MAGRARSTDEADNGRGQRAGDPPAHDRGLVVRERDRRRDRQQCPEHGDRRGAQSWQAPRGVLAPPGAAHDGRVHNGRELNIKANLDTFLAACAPTDRYASFDYCFNHFQPRSERGRAASLAEADGLQLYCLHLGFYLASWGMYRGSTVLLGGAPLRPCP